MTAVAVYIYKALVSGMWLFFGFAVVLFTAVGFHGFASISRTASL